MQYDTEKIHTIVSDLKEAKTKSFQSINELADFKKVTETCRIIDTFILPLYYIWEHCCYMQIDELELDRHLKKAYHKYLQKPMTNTLELYLLISMDAPFMNLFGKTLSKQIAELYKELLDSKKDMFLEEG